MEEPIIKKRNISIMKKATMCLPFLENINNKNTFPHSDAYKIMYTFSSKSSHWLTE